MFTKVRIMKTTIKKLITFGLAAVVLAALSTVADAAIHLTFYDANYVGRIYDSQPSSAADEAGYINDLITLDAGDGITDVGGSDYDRINSTLAGPFATAVVTGASRGAANSRTMTLVGTFQYVLAKYDGPNWGDEVWYFEDGITGDIDVPQYPFGQNQYGVSHISAYNQVAIPEASTFAIWGLFGLLGLAIHRKNLS